MKSVEYFTWTLPPDAWNKRPHTSRWKMSREKAEKDYPGATPILSTREVRQVAETPQEAAPFRAGMPYGQ